MNVSTVLLPPTDFAPGLVLVSPVLSKMDFSYVHQERNQLFAVCLCYCLVVSVAKPDSRDVEDGETRQSHISNGCVLKSN